MSAGERSSGRRYRVTKPLRWLEGRPGPGGWEGGRLVDYKPGDFLYVDDLEVEHYYHYLEPIDDAGRAVLEEARAKAEAPAKITFVAELDAEQHNSLVWALARTKQAQGEELRTSLLWAIRNGAKLPDDSESRDWIADALEGKLDPERGRGRPQKPQRWSMVRAAVERAIAEAYQNWLAIYKRDPELAQLRAEALRLREQHPDASVWRGHYDLGNEEERRAFAMDLEKLGARLCLPKLRGEKPPREFALEATAREFKAGWKNATGRVLTPSEVARIVTRERAPRAKKPE